MSLRKLILLVIFVWGSTASSQSGGIKLQMKDGNFFFDDGSGDVAIEELDKGTDLSCLQDSIDPSSKATSTNLYNTLSLLDKTIGDLETGEDKKKAFSEMDVVNQRERISELRKMLADSNFVETPRKEDEEEEKMKSALVNTAQIAENPSVPTKEKQESKISDADLQKVREVLDKEYGKSILLIPKRDLESFIHFVKDYSINYLLKNSDSAEYRELEEYMRQNNPTNASNSLFSLNHLLTTQPQKAANNQEVSEKDRKQIIQQVARFIGEINAPKDSAIQPQLRQNSINLFRDTDRQTSFASNNGQNPMKNSPSQEPVSAALVRDLLDNLSEDKTQLKQSLLRWFDKNSESDMSRQRHNNIRRSLKKGSTTSPPLRKSKKIRKYQKKDKITYQRISQGNYPNLRKKRHKKAERTLDDIDSSEYDSRPREERSFKSTDINLKANGEQNLNENAFSYQAKEDETGASGERRTRADFIR